MIQKTASNQSIFQNMNPISISPKDDAFHNLQKFINIEWWYFDAILNDDYTLHAGVRIYHSKKIGLVQTTINIYKRGKLIAHSLKRDLLNNIIFDEDLPNISTKDQQIITFNKEEYKTKNKWEYKFKSEIDNIQLNLTFTGITQGWKIVTSDTCWVVPLPKALVRGSVGIRGKKIEVHGIGYHDHNWNYSPITAMNNYGWFWGRIFTNSYGITWANTKTSPHHNTLLAVINKDNDLTDKSYINFLPSNITFTADHFVSNHRKKIPTHFKLKINQIESKTKTPIRVHVDLDSVEIHYSRIFTINYWRYHVQSSGEIHYNNQRESIDKRTQIIEFLNFKS